MAAARRLLFRLFLEGIEVPVVGARISSAEGAPAAAVIQVVPTDRVMDLHPRTLVHLFALDIVNYPESGTLPAVAPEGTPEATLLKLENYKLIFHGVYVGFRVLKEGARRQTTLQCVGPSSSWDNVHQYSMTYGPRNGAWGNRFSEEEVNLFDDITGNPAKATSKLFQGKPKYGEFRDVDEGVLAGVLSFLEAVGGVPDAYKGVNDFTTVEELRLHVLDQLAFIPQDDSALKLFSKTAFKKWLKNQLGRMGALASVRTVVNQVLGYIYHRVSTNPAPKYEPGGEPYTTQETVSASNLNAEAKELVAKLIEALEDLDDQTTEARNQLTGGVDYGGFGIHPVDERVAKVGVSSHLGPWQRAQLGLLPIREYVVAGPVGLTVATKGVSAYIGHDRFMTKLGYSCEQVNRVIRRGLVPLVSSAHSSVMLELEEAVGELRSAFHWTPAPPPPSAAEVARAALPPDDDYTIGDAATGYLPSDIPEDPGGAPTEGTSTSMMQGHIRRAITHLKSADGTHPETVTHNHVTAPKLKSLIIHPDVWFVPPPRCNVLFPEQYVRFEISRDLMQEISRYQIRAGLEMKRADKLEWYYSAPNISDYLEKEDKYFRESPVILPHEEYTGIISKMHSMEELALYLTSAEKAKTLDAAGEGKDRVAFTQRVAHYNFYLYRFAARSARVTALFNYHLVCGFPLLLIDKPFLAPPELNTTELLWGIQHESVEAMLAESTLPWGSLPNQFLGVVSSLDHTVDQNGGGTVAHLSHVRTHRSAYGTDDEFLNSRLAEEGQSWEGVTSIVLVLNFDTLKARGDLDALGVLADCTPNPPPTDVEPTGTPYPVVAADATPLTEGLPALGVDPAKVPPEVAELGTYNDCALRVGGPFGSALTKRRRLTAEGGTVVVAAPDVPIEDLAQVEYLRSNGIIRREEVGGVAQNFYDTVTIVVQGNFKVDGTLSTVLPIEEAIRPDWVGDVYGNDQIGEKVYQDFFGTGSLVDEQVFLVAQAVKADEEGGGPPGTTGDVADTYTKGEYAATHSEYGAISNRTASGAPITDVAAVTRDADGLLSNVVAVELEASEPKTLSLASAVDTLAVVYGAAVSGSLDVTRFVWEYGYRPVATLVDIFGARDYQLDKTGKALSQKEIDTAAKAALGPDSFSPARTADGVLTDWSRYGKGYVSPTLADADKKMLQDRWARIQAGGGAAAATPYDFDIPATRAALEAGLETSGIVGMDIGPAPETIDAWEDEAQEVADLEKEIADAQVAAPDEGTTYPREGFHSRALADLEPLVGLVTDETGAPVDLSSKTYSRRDGLGEKEPVSPSVDHRKDRKQRVLDYLATLKLRGVRG